MISPTSTDINPQRRLTHAVTALRFQRTLAREGLSFVEIMRVLCECILPDIDTPGTSKNWDEVAIMTTL